MRTFLTPSYTPTTTTISTTTTTATRLYTCLSRLPELDIRDLSPLHILNIPLTAPPAFTNTTNTMAALSFSSNSAGLSFGRSGYNKSGSSNGDDRRNFGRSGYNKGGDDDEQRLFGRSGYNKDGDNDDGLRNFGRSGYN